MPSAGDIYERLFETAPDAVVVVDQLGVIVLANLQAEQLFGHAREKLVGLGVETLIPPRFAASHVEHWTRFFASPELRPMSNDIQLYGLRSDGTEFPIEISLSPLVMPQGKLTSASIRDITQRKQNELELQRARADAEAASSATSELLACMSFELRTPLNAILGFSQLLQRDIKSPLSLRQQARIQHVLQGAEHLLHLVDEVLDFARIEAGRLTLSPEPCTVEEVLADVESGLVPVASRYEVTLVIEPTAAPLPTVIADRTRFKQVLSYYGANAVRFGRRGGRAVFQAAQRGELVRITVIDDGMGIPEDKQGAVFRPVLRAGQEAGSIEGTGIDLAITKHLAERMQGRVGFSSVPGKGSQFWIELPVARTNAA